MTDPDAFWRRPADGDEPAPRRPQLPAEPDKPSEYAGPPSSSPPPKGWQPPIVVQPPAPRQLPPQNVSGVEVDERGARTLTYGVGMIAGAVLVIVICLLCSRLLF